MNKKSFLLGILTGVLSVAIGAGVVLGGMAINEKWEESEEIAYDEGTDDEEVVESTAVFAESGNPVITDVEGNIKIEVIPPSGYTVGEDYESAYDTEFYNENKAVRLEYSIENNTADEMNSYYEFEVSGMQTSQDPQYENISVSDIKTMEVNGYTVNYLSLSYTYNETENYTEYCAYVMLDDATEFMCGIYGKTEDVSEDLIKDCFNAQLPVTK